MVGIGLVAIVGSLALLGIILSPVSPLMIFQGETQRSSTSEEPIDEAKIAPSDVTQEHFTECNSINDGVQAIVAGDGSNETRKLAADLLVGEYCNRPDLVNEISAATDPGLALSAYACDAASRRVGDNALQESLSDHTFIYCESARAAIFEKLESLEEAIDGYRQDYLAELEEADPGDGSAAYDIEAIKGELESVVRLAEESKSLLIVGKDYESAMTLERGSSAFDSLLQKTENF